MKVQSIIGLGTIAISLFFFSACSTDNYDGPETMFTGRLLVVNEPLHIYENPTQEESMFQLYQDGYDKHTAIYVHVNQNGEFSARLFNGEYKMIPVSQKYLWEWTGWENKKEDGSPDTIRFTLKGNKQMDIQVTPFFKFKNVSARIDGENVTADFQVEQLNSDYEVSTVYLMANVNRYFGKLSDLRKSTTKVSLDETMNLSIPLSSYYSDSYFKNNYRKYIFVRLAMLLKKQSGYYLYSDVYRVDIPDEVYQKFRPGE